MGCHTWHRGNHRLFAGIPNIPRRSYEQERRHDGGYALFGKKYVVGSSVKDLPWKLPLYSKILPAGCVFEIAEFPQRAVGQVRHRFVQCVAVDAFPNRSAHPQFDLAHAGQEGAHRNALRIRLGAWFEAVEFRNFNRTDVEFRGRLSSGDWRTALLG